MDKLEEILDKAVDLAALDVNDAITIRRAIQFLANMMQVHPMLQKELKAQWGRETLDDIFDLLEKD